MRMQDMSRVLAQRALWGALLAMLLVVTGCATVPLTGRSQLTLVGDSELAAMSATEYQKVLKEGPLSQDQAKVGQLRAVGSRISAAVEQFCRERQLPASFHWEFNLIDDPKMVNAWAMPGGKIAFYTGILPICQDDTGIAVVMGHEIAHVIARHGNERVSQGLIAEFGMQAASAAMTNQTAATKQMVLTGLGLGAQYGVMMPFGRGHELEADHIGLIVMAMAGYDPNAAVGFWQRMAKAGGGAPPEWLSTHPSNTSRISDIKKHLPEAMKYYQPSGRAAAPAPAPAAKPATTGKKSKATY